MVLKSLSLEISIAVIKKNFLEKGAMIFDTLLIVYISVHISSKDKSFL